MCRQTKKKQDGNTCAHIAAKQGSVAVLQQLMKFDLQVVTTSCNRTSDSIPLHLAAEGGHVDVTKILLDAGASVLDENKVPSIDSLIKLWRVIKKYKNSWLDITVVVHEDKVHSNSSESSLNYSLIEWLSYLECLVPYFTTITDLTLPLWFMLNKKKIGRVYCHPVGC